ncbi:hypothetical protein Tco_0625305 [Tanacetum coccineum]|uniref:Uncharacterized protein n=1 Tax=Tanacetum coccineum TaxID=301880 RepID=A0ABQ4WGE6_9ASTR
MSKLLYTCFTKLIINHFLSCNKNIPCRSDSEMHSEGDDSPLTKLSNTVDDKFKFGMKIPDTMINDAFKKSVGYKLGKGYMRSGKQEANIPITFKKNVVPRKTRSLSVADNIVEEPVVVELTKSICIEEQRRQQRDIDAIQDSSCSDTNEEKDVETDDSKDSNLDLSEDEPRGDDDATEYDQKLEALTSINVYKAIDKAVHAKVMTKMKKLTPTHVLKVLANYVKPRLNNFVLEVIIHENKTDPTNQKLYDTLYASILFDQEALDAQEAAPSILK